MKLKGGSNDRYINTLRYLNSDNEKIIRAFEQPNRDICCIHFNYDIILLLSYIYICGHNITYQVIVG